jgi:hypothetical protein
VSGRGTEAQLDALHGFLTDALQTELTNALAARDEDDNPIPVNPQLLDKVMKFLIANGVSAPKASPKIDRLAQTLTDLDLDAEARGDTLQ